MQSGKTRKRAFYVCTAGLIAALYVVLTLASSALGLASAPVQLRISEALCVLPFFTSAALPGLSVGCLLSNLLAGCIWQDVLFGTLATLLGSVGARLLRRVWWAVPLPTVLANTVILPFVMAYGYRFEAGLPYLMLTVGMGELLSAYLCGLVLLRALMPHGNRIFHLDGENRMLWNNSK